MAANASPSLHLVLVWGEGAQGLGQVPRGDIDGWVKGSVWVERCHLMAKLPEHPLHSTLGT